MITTPTVFIFGAGVSMPYGFPSGKTLLKQIHETTKTSITDLSEETPKLYEIGKMLREEFGDKLVMEFGDELFLSQQASIDAFLEHRPEFMKIGKTAIALCLARIENEEILLSMDVRDKGCYQYLFQKMNSDWDGFSKNQVGFITFNYDRSLEEYLFTGLKYTYGKNDEECAAIINNIPIIHLHGSLGPLPWQSSMGIPYTDKYVSAASGKTFGGLYRERMRENLIVISEGQDESKEFKQAFELMDKSKSIYFLGFGYHPVNIRRLKLDKLGEIKSFFGSAMGMEKAEMDNAKALIADKSHYNHHIHIEDNTSDSLLFLRKYGYF